MIRNVAAWLSMQSDFMQPTPTAKTILDAFPNFRVQLETEKANGLGTLTWGSIIICAQTTVREMPSV